MGDRVIVPGDGVDIIATGVKLSRWRVGEGLVEPKRRAAVGHWVAMIYIALEATAQETR